jgi:TIR domain
MSSYLPAFETDVFVSYGHLDNSPVPLDQQNWISRFHTDLKDRVSQYLGTEVDVWRDNLLGGPSPLEEILRILNSTGVCISIFSPRVLTSEWCQRELSTFIEAAALKYGVKVGTRSRLLKVVVIPVDLTSQKPALMQQVLGYDFYVVDENGRPRQLPDWALLPDAERRYRAKLDDLAYDLHFLLKDLKNLIEDPKVPPSPPPAGSIYLAETTKELSNSRDQIRRELLAKGYQVLPDRSLPLEVSQLTSLVSGQLEACLLSLHLIGSEYGMVPASDSGETRSVAWLQQELAAQRASNGTLKFHCLLWAPPGTAVTDPNQKRYLDQLQEQLRDKASFELVKIPFEGLKNYVFDKLNEASPPPIRPPGLMYLICEQTDRKEIEQIKKYYLTNKVDVELPLLEGDQTVIRRDHEATLQECDGVLIYYGSGSEAWLREKIRDLRRARGLGRQRPYKPQVIVIGPEETESKKNYANGEFLVIRIFGNSSPPGPMLPFPEAA